MWWPFRTGYVLVLAALAGCSPIRNSSQRDPEPTYQPGKWLITRSDDGCISMEVLVPQYLEVGLSARVLVLLRNTSGSDIIMSRIVPNNVVGTGLGPDVRLYAPAGFFHGRYGFAERATKDDLMTLRRGEKLIYAYDLVPILSGRANLGVTFTRPQDEVSVDTVFFKPVDPKRPDGPGRGPVGSRSVRVPGMWKGHVAVSDEVYVSEPRRSKVDQHLKFLRYPGPTDFEKWLRVMSLIEESNQLAVVVLSEYAVGLPQDSQLRAQCYGWLLKMALDGIAIDRIPDVIREARESRNPAELRLLLINGLGEFLKKPSRGTEIGHNYILVTVKDEALKAIKEALTELASSGQPRISDAAKAALP